MVSPPHVQILREITFRGQFEGTVLSHTSFISTESPRARSVFLRERGELCAGDE